jgi:hypothetical protein
LEKEMIEPTQAELVALWNVCKAFIEEQHVSCEEACCEDRVYEEAPNLVADIGGVVGFYEYPEDEE